MAFTQVPQGGGGFQQIHPENGGFNQLHDSNNPAAQAYARAALARNGIHVPPGADATAIWRQFSQQRAGQQAGAQAQGPDPYDPGVNPSQPLGGGAPMPPQHPMPDYGTGPMGGGMPAPGPGPLGAAQLGQRMPYGGFQPHHPLDQGLGNVQDWRNRIQLMAHNLSSANHHVDMGQQFQHNLGGPAENAVGLAKMLHVNQAHHAAKNLAALLANTRPSAQRRSVRSNPLAQ